MTPEYDRRVLEFPGDLRLPNVCDFYEDFLANHPLPAA